MYVAQEPGIPKRLCIAYIGLRVCVVREFMIDRNIYQKIESNFAALNPKVIERPLKNKQTYLFIILLSPALLAGCTGDVSRKECLH